jgi:hypothetical protein
VVPSVTGMVMVSEVIVMRPAWATSEPAARATLYWYWHD